MLTEPYEIFVREALGVPDPTIVAAIIVSPSFRHPWMLSIHRGTHGRRRLRVTKLDQDVWGLMMQRMRDLQGDVVSLDANQESRALARVSVNPSRLEQDLDRSTADLLISLWHLLIARAQIVESDSGIADGTQYELSLPGQAGTIVSPATDTILGDVTAAAERLGAIVETPAVSHVEDLRYVRSTLRYALLRAKQNEPCLRAATR